MKESPISQTDTKTDFLLQKKKDHRNQIQSYEIETSPHIPNPTPESRHFNHERIAHIADKNEEKETRERERERLTIRDSSCTKQTTTNRIGFLELHATHNRPRSRGGSPDTPSSAPPSPLRRQTTDDGAQVSGPEKSTPHARGRNSSKWKHQKKEKERQRRAEDKRGARAMAQESEGLRQRTSLYTRETTSR